MKTFQDLQEGLQDPNIFKAFFLAGGPGSGKSYVVRSTTGGTGLRIVNSDDIFEKGLASVIHPDDVAMIQNALGNAFEGKTVSELLRYKIPNSTEYQTIYQSFSPVKDDTNNKISTVKSVGKLELKEI